MAKALTQRVPDNVTLATTVTRLTRTAFETWDKLTIDRRVSGTTTYVYVDLVGTADGAALPSTGYLTVAVANLPAEVDITGWGSVGLAGDASGVVDVVIS